MKKIKKLRDVTPDQWEFERPDFCRKHECVTCPLRMVNCHSRGWGFWACHKDMYSDEFLDQEIEVEE